MSASPTKPALRYFGDYVLLGEIARGGMGVVFQARQLSLDREVAIKMIHAGTLASPVLVQRFRAEAQAMAQLDHPNIVPIYEIGEHDGQHYFSMKLIEGGSLAERMATAEDRRTDRVRSGEKIAFDIRSSTFVISQVARAVHHAHQRGVIHRDLKPGNILLDERGEPLVADFGLAKLIDSELGLTQSVCGLGTAHYMPPEQAAGKSKQITVAADLYSLGAILFELLTGRPPFLGEGRDAVIQQVLHEEPPRPRALNPAVDRDLETICLKCLEKDPPRRYRTAEELAEDLEAWQDGKPIQARPISMWERSVKWVRRRPAIAALVAALALTFVLGLGIGISQYRQAVHARRQADDSLGQLREAVTKYLSVIAANPRNKPTDPAFLREELLQTTISYLDDFTRFRSADPALERQRGLAYLGLSRIKANRNETGAALTNGFQGRAILAALMVVDPDSVPLRIDLANADLALGALLSAGSRLAEADQHLLRALNTWQSLTNREVVAFNARRQLANTYNRLCDLRRRQNRPDDALDLQRRGLRVREALVADVPRAWDEKLNVAIDYNSLALALATAPLANTNEMAAVIKSRSAPLTSDPARIRESEATYRHAIQMYEALVAERPRDETARVSLALSSWGFGNMLGALNQPSNALVFLGKALDHYETLAVQHPQNAGYKSNVENTRGKMERWRAPVEQQRTNSPP